MDGQTDVQHETIMTHHYHVLGYKKELRMPSAAILTDEFKKFYATINTSTVTVSFSFHVCACPCLCACNVCNKRKKYLNISPTVSKSTMMIVHILVNS